MKNLHSTVIKSNKQSLYKKGFDFLLLNSVSIKGILHMDPPMKKKWNFLAFAKIQKLRWIPKLTFLKLTYLQAHSVDIIYIFNIHFVDFHDALWDFHNSLWDFRNWRKLVQ